MDGNRRIGAASFRFLALNTVNQPQQAAEVEMRLKCHTY